MELGATRVEVVQDIMDLPKTCLGTGRSGGLGAGPRYDCVLNLVNVGSNFAQEHLEVRLLVTEVRPLGAYKLD